MAYTKQTWADLPSKTTPINASRLGHIEDGIYDAAATADNAASTAGSLASRVGIAEGKITNLEQQKVDKETGKGLSTNDYSNAEKAKVGSIAPTEADSTSASTDYEVGEEFFLSDGNLYTATSPISQGSAIVVYPTSGYNCKLSESVTGQIKTGFTEVASDIADIKSYIGYEGTPIVGVQVDFEAKTFTRLGLAAGLHGGDDFDTFHAFGGRRRCTVADDGTINHYYGDTGYTEDGSDGQVMVYQPKFYYKRQILKKTAQTGNGKGYNIRKANWFVSDTPAAGFKVHPAFLDENGNEVDYILIGAYEGSLYDVSANAYITDDSQVMDNTADKFCSIAGAKPASGLTQDLTRPKIEQMCQNRGSRWHEQNVQTFSVTQLLYLIEYGDFDIQRSIGQGVANITDQSAYNCSANTGSTASFGNKSGRATSTTFNIGGTTTTETADGKTSITYRGEENACLNIWKFIMGMNIYGNGSMNGGEPYVCTDYNYVESKNDGNYKSVGFRLPAAGDWVSAFGCAADESEFDWIFVPGECTGANNALPVGDYHWNTANLNGYRIARVGATWNGSWYGGLFCWNCDNGVGNRARNVGGRLAYIPSGA